MEENLLEPIPVNKLYKESAIRLGTFIGGPLVAGYLMAENFKSLGQPEKVKNTWLITIAALIIVIVFVFLPNINLPNFLIPVTYTLLAGFLFRKYQGPDVKLHIEKGGEIYSIWQAVLISLIGLLVTVALIFIALLIITPDFFRQIHNTQ